MQGSYQGDLQGEGKPCSGTDSDGGRRTEIDGGRCTHVYESRDLVTR